MFLLQLPLLIQRLVIFKDYFTTIRYKHDLSDKLNLTILMLLVARLLLVGSSLAEFRLMCSKYVPAEQFVRMFELQIFFTRSSAFHVCRVGCGVVVTRLI